MPSKRGAGECLFCRRISDPSQRGPLVYEDPLVLAAHQLEARGETYRGAIVIQTRRHTAGGLPDLTEEEGERIGWLVVRISRALREVVGAGWTYTYCFTEGFRHVHQFVVARYPETPARHVRLGLTDWKRAPRGGPAEIRGLARQLRSRIGGPKRRRSASKLRPPASRPEQVGALSQR